MSLNFDEELKKIEKNLGTPPRSFSFMQKSTYLKLRNPGWKWEESDLALIIPKWPEILKNGKLSWGHVIMANSLMFETSIYDHPGLLLIDTDPCETSPAELESTSMQMYQLKISEHQAQTSDKMIIQELLQDEHNFPIGFEVPKEFNPYDDRFISTVYFQRKHLPENRLITSLLPVIYCEETKITFIVPSKYWSPEFIEWWKEE